MAIAAASVVAVTPSVASTVLDADTVDKKHAVGAKVSKAKRAGKLVATNSKGVLPGNIIRKAPDADSLDGLDSLEFVTRTASPGAVQQGGYVASGSDGSMATHVAFGSALRTALPGQRVTFIPAGGAATPQCPGPGEVAVDNWLCVYEGFGVNRAYEGIFKTASGQPGADPDGFGIFMVATASDAVSFGRWAVRAGPSNLVFAR